MLDKERDLRQIDSAVGDAGASPVAFLRGKVSYSSDYTNDLMRGDCRLEDRWPITNRMSVRIRLPRLFLLGGGVVDRVGLENRNSLLGVVGSNPTLALTVQADSP